VRWAKRGEYYAISDCSKYKVAVWYGDGEPMYLLSYGNETLGWYDTAKQAQHEAERHKGVVGNGLEKTDSKNG